MYECIHTYSMYTYICMYVYIHTYDTAPSNSAQPQPSSTHPNATPNLMLLNAQRSTADLFVALYIPRLLRRQSWVRVGSFYLEHTFAAGGATGSELADRGLFPSTPLVVEELVAELFSSFPPTKIKLGW